MSKKNECRFIDCRDNFITQDGDYYLVRCPKCLLENHLANVSTGMCGWCGWIAKGNVTDEEDTELNIRLMHELEN